jgi:hypothetical protein
LGRVTDPYFVPDLEYMQGLVDMIPAKKQGDTLIALYRNNNWGQASNFELVIKELVSRVAEGEIEDLLSVISEDLQKVDDAGFITLVIKTLPNELWPQIERMPRLRAEKMLLDELRAAWYIPASEHTNNPNSTWISRITKYYLRKRSLGTAIIEKLSTAMHKFAPGWSR